MTQKQIRERREMLEAFPMGPSGSFTEEITKDLEALRNTCKHPDKFQINSLNNDDGPYRYKCPDCGLIWC